MSDGFADDELMLSDWEEGYYARQCEEDDVVETLRVELVNLRNELIRTRAAAGAWKRSAKMWRDVNIWATSTKTHRKKYRALRSIRRLSGVGVSDD